MNTEALQYELKAHLDAILPSDVAYRVFLNTESSSFIRFNHAQVRQPGSVEQAHSTIEVSQGQRHFKCHISLSSSTDENRVRLERALKPQLELLVDLDPDPHFLTKTEVDTITYQESHDATSAQETVQDILRASTDLDLVGIYASGKVGRSYFDSLGSDLRHEAERSHFDFSVYAHHDKAVKCSVSGDTWNFQKFESALTFAKSQLPYLHLEARKIEPGKYRCYLAPSAVRSVLSLLSWSSFSEKAHQTGLSPLKELKTGESQLSPKVNLMEAPALLKGPRFNETGFVSPEETVLIKDGRYASSLVSPRSGKEFGLAHNGASPSESPSYLSMEAGDIPTDQILKHLGTGVFISDLWYLNFSDPQVCRMTGMTRFASLWVEDGKIVAPLSVMRFDDSVFDMFGDNLAGLTAESEVFHEAHTYGSRNTSAMKVPGALIDGFTFTL